ncbi:hypothetical protein TNCT_565141 [Trichonephila clavata]|uniref:Uncharacterized protein n=1 Tax=Trichonephila clavata TaxID=2740835 RepID=A0A8X6LHP6_TRICU|nr:hypothetical protein TNCT_565141 [Trichonephila clavata]
MDLSLPSSGNTSRPDTPSFSNCERITMTTLDIKKFTNLLNGTQYMIKSMHLDGFNSEDDPSLQDLRCRLAHYQSYIDMAVSDLSSLPFCDTPDCTVHSTPPQSPTKINSDNPEISTKKTQLKVKKTRTASPLLLLEN